MADPPFKTVDGDETACNIYLKLDRIKVFRTFSSGVSFLLFHWFNIFSHLARIGIKFKVVTFSRSTVKWSPSKSNSVEPHTKFYQVSSFSLDNFFFPHQMSLVLSLLLIKPESKPKISNVFRAAYRVFVFLCYENMFRSALNIWLKLHYGFVVQPLSLKQGNPNSFKGLPKSQYDVRHGK